MAEDDFGIESLAAYLHLDPAQVVRLAERGKLPGRKVGGQWRFAQPVIHHWLEERIGLSSDEELEQMEGVLRKAAGEMAAAVDRHRRLAADPGDRHPAGSAYARLRDLDVGRRGGRYRLAVGHGQDGRGGARPRRHGPHGVGKWRGGLASAPTVAGDPGARFFGAGPHDEGHSVWRPRGVLTDLFFLVCSTNDREHLPLARLSRLISDADLLDTLRHTPDAAAAHAAIVERETRL